MHNLRPHLWKGVHSFIDNSRALLSIDNSRGNLEDYFLLIILEDNSRLEFIRIVCHYQWWNSALLESKHDPFVGNKFGIVTEISDLQITTPNSFIWIHKINKKRNFKFYIKKK